MDSCSSCGGQIPEGVRFCPHCGAEQQSKSLEPTGAAVENPASTAPAKPERALEWAWCEIEWVRSFRGSEFQARPLSPGLDGIPPRSSAFRWRADEPPSEINVDAREAHEELVRLLVTQGWEPAGTAGSWYAERFRRPADPDERPASKWQGPPAGLKQLAIALVVLVSVAIIIFTVLVLLGSFRGKHPRGTAEGLAPVALSLRKA
jgi:hypothetical protein